MWTPQQQAEAALKWIQELEQTTHIQGSGMLGDEEIGFCCLGLGCHIFDIEHTPEQEFSSDFQDRVGLYSEDGDSSIADLDGATSLAELNDRVFLHEHVYDFKYISQYLRENHEHYFEPEVSKLLQILLNNEKKQTVKGPDT